MLHLDKITVENDIALVRLRDPVTLNENINIACLPRNTEEEVNDKSKCFVAGWGTTGKQNLRRPLKIHTLI